MLSALLALVVGLVAMCVVISCGMFVVACASVYVPADWDQRRDNLLRRLLQEFGMGRGVDHTDWRLRRLSVLLPRPDLQRVPGVPSDRDLLTPAVLRMSRGRLLPHELRATHRYAEILGLEARRRIASWARSRTRVDHVLLLWRPICWLAVGHFWSVGIRRELVPAALRLGARAASMAGACGIAGVVIAFLVHYIGGGSATANALTSLLELVGTWMAGGAVVGVLVVLATEVRAVWRQLLEVTGASRRRAVLALCCMSIVLVMASAVSTFEFPASLGAWQADALAFLLDSVPDDLMVAGGGVLFGVLMLWVATRALRRAAHRTLTLPGRVSAGTWSALFVIMVAVSFAAVVAPGSRGFVWLGYSMVIIFVLGYVAWTVLHLRAHVSRVRALRALGVAVERKWYSTTYFRRVRTRWEQLHRSHPSELKMAPFDVDGT